MNGVQVGSDCFLRTAFCLLPSLSSEHARIQRLWIAEHDEAQVAHIFSRDALHIGGCNRAQMIDQLDRVPPAAANQFGLRQLADLGGVGFLAHVVARQKLRDD